MALMSVGAANLAEWIKTEGLGYAEVAERLKASVSTVKNILAGRRNPGPELAFRIERVTRGKVKAKSFFPDA